MLFKQSVASLALQASACLATCDVAVTLEGYGSFVGTTADETMSGHPLPQGFDAWLGIDYSTQPTGKNRFKPVDWPAPFDGLKDAKELGKKCIQDAPSDEIGLQDEACLNFNVFRTKGVSMEKKVPVLVWFHGGAFNSGSWSSFDAAAFAASSKEDIVVVQPHYRINSLGFLPSALFEEEGLLNLGMRDQHFFLQFVQKHIAAFGGDPDQVTIGGRSAGAHSTGIHYFHNYGDGKDENLFVRAIHQSGGVTARAFPNATYPLYVKQFEEYMDYLECPMDDNEEALKCLRSADINAIRNISTAIYDKYDPPLTWPFQPTQGGPMLEKFGSESGYDGTFFHVPTITSTTTDEAKYYVPGDLETNEDWLDYLYNISPEMNDEDLEMLESLYPDPATNPDSPFANSPNSTQYNRVASAWSDYAYICPGQETATIASAADVPVWKLRFNTNQTFPSWQGIPHTADTKYTWDEPEVQHRDISHVYHAYLASFVTAGDPNAHRWPGTPEWPNYVEENGEQLVVQPGNTKVEQDVIRKEACQFWRHPERAPRLNK